MIDTDKYEGHLASEGQTWAWSKWMLKNAESKEQMDATSELLADAPLLLEEVKRLRGLLKITAQSYLDDVRSEDMLGEVSVKKEYEICEEIADVLGVSIVSGYTLHADGYDMVSEFGRYFVYLDEDGEMVMLND